MLIEFDTAKRDETLLERGLDFADCSRVFAGLVLTQLDSRSDYGEERYITFGLLDALWWFWSGLPAVKIAALFP